MDGRIVYIIIGIFNGVIRDIRIFLDQGKAIDYEHELCRIYDIPFDEIERERYYDIDGRHEIHHKMAKVH